jgi:hypothetical protein
LTDIESLYCGSVFPNPQVFQGCETALCLFSAEWLGQQDAYWIAKAGLTGECVDLQSDKLAEMEAIYPDGWRFHTADAYEFARHAANQGRAWDVLTMDPWTGQFDKCAQLIDLWTAITRRVIVLGHGNYRLPAPAAPAGWRTLDVIKRSDFKGGVYWYVMVNDA